MLVLFFGPKQSLSDNAIDKSLYLPCIQHKTQNGVAYGCRAATIILRQPQILKSHGYNTSYFMRIFFNQYLFSKAEWKTNLNQVNLCLCQCSLRLRDAFNFLTLLAVNTTEHQKSNFFNAIRKPLTHCIDDKSIETHTTMHL